MIGLCLVLFIIAGVLIWSYWQLHSEDLFLKTPFWNKDKQGGYVSVLNRELCGVRVYHTVLPLNLFGVLRNHLMRVINSNFVLPDQPGVLTGTYWISLSITKDKTPRNGIEASIIHMWKSNALRSIIDMEDIIGAEWWYQELDPDEHPKGWHTDCDVYTNPDGTAATRNPVVSSVFYFDAVGGPTVVCGQRSTGEGGLVPVYPTQISVTFPYPNQLMLFGGDLFHAVFHQTKTTIETRYTLLINWWTEKPSGASDLPACFCWPISEFISDPIEVKPQKNGLRRRKPRKHQRKMGKEKTDVKYNHSKKFDTIDQHHQSKKKNLINPKK